MRPPTPSPTIAGRSGVAVTQRWDTTPRSWGVGTLGAACPAALPPPGACRLVGHAVGGQAAACSVITVDGILAPPQLVKRSVALAYVYTGTYGIASVFCSCCCSNGGTITRRVEVTSTNTPASADEYHGNTVNGVSGSAAAHVIYAMVPASISHFGHCRHWAGSCFLSVTSFTANVTHTARGVNRIKKPNKIQ